jgi:hypothetical protein
MRQFAVPQDAYPKLNNLWRECRALLSELIALHALHDVHRGAFGTTDGTLRNDFRHDDNKLETAMLFKSLHRLHRCCL